LLVVCSAGAERIGLVLVYAGFQAEPALVCMVEEHNYFRRETGQNEALAFRKGGLRRGVAANLRHPQVARVSRREGHGLGGGRERLGLIGVRGRRGRLGVLWRRRPCHDCCRMWRRGPCCDGHRGGHSNWHSNWCSNWCSIWFWIRWRGGNRGGCMGHGRPFVFGLAGCLEMVRDFRRYGDCGFGVGRRSTVGLRLFGRGGANLVVWGVGSGKGSRGGRTIRGGDSLGLGAAG